MICISSKEQKGYREKFENLFISSQWKIFDQFILFQKLEKYLIISLTPTE